MPAAPHPRNEGERVHNLRALGILDTDPEERFDRLTRLARRLFDVPTALISLVDSDRQWFKSRVGLEAQQTPRDQSFCAHAILDDVILIVPDATRDERFRTNPLVTHSPEIRFYAGCPVKGPDGSPLGTICVIGHEPREFAEEDEVVLRDLAEMVERELKSLALATTDDLTGLSNRRGFEVIAEHALAMCRRHARPATMLLFDLNGFKEVNDTLGHAAGDRQLQDFATALLSTFRDSDVVARLGGDEFGVLLSGATGEDVDRPVALLAEQLRGADRCPDISFSVGTATYDAESHETVPDLVAEADARMYEHKRSGS